MVRICDGREGGKGRTNEVSKVRECDPLMETSMHGGEDMRNGLEEEGGRKGGAVGTHLRQATHEDVAHKQQHQAHLPIAGLVGARRYVDGQGPDVEA